MKNLSILTIGLLISISVTAQTWSAVGTGLDSTVNAMYADTMSNALYAVGPFKGKVASWDGMKWDTLGFPGVYEPLCVTSISGIVYVGSDSIYKYNTNTKKWSTAAFISAGGGGAFRIAYNFNGTPVFAGYVNGNGGQNLNIPTTGKGFNNVNNDVVFSMDLNDNGTILAFRPSANAFYGVKQYGNDLFIYGGFTNLVNSSNNMMNPATISIAKYSGNTLYSITTPSTTTTTICSSAEVYNNELYISGAFSAFNGVNSTNNIKYVSGSFVATNLGLAGMTVYSGKVYGINSNTLSCFGVGSSTITAVSTTTINPSCTTVFNGEIYFGGNFITPYKNITKYNANPTLVVSTNVTSTVTCKGGNNGSASSTVSGGLSPYSYKWSNNQTTSNAANLTAGTYTLTVKDAAGMVKTSTVAITQPLTILTATVSSTAETAVGQNDGTTTVTSSGGISPYNFVWSSSQTNSVATGLTGGVYTCNVTDANSCNVVKSVTVTTNPPPTFTITGTNVTCNSGNNGTANTTVNGGVSPYRFSWSNGATTSSVTNLVSGIYTVTLTDNANVPQVVTHTVNISQPTVFTVTVTPNASTINQGNSVTLNSSAATQYYLWNNNATTQSINVNASGNYSVTVTNAAGCSATSNVVTVTVIPLPAVPTITANTYTLTSSSSTGNQWYLNGNIINGATSQTYVATQSGDYTVKVTNWNGGSSTSVAYTVTINTPPTGINTIEQNNVLIYPNPSNGIINIEAENSVVDVINSIGQVIQHEFVNGNGKTTFVIETSGMYVIQIVKNNTIINSKVIIQ